MQARRAVALSAVRRPDLALSSSPILFGLFQGGIVPSYAVIVREYFPPQEAGARVGIVIMCDRCSAWRWAAGCRAASSTSRAPIALHSSMALAWNLLNLSIAVWLLRAGRTGRHGPAIGLTICISASVDCVRPRVCFAAWPSRACASVPRRTKWPCPNPPRQRHLQDPRQMTGVPLKGQHC